eukprot:2236454-Pleurochrysis_carterae.AAC.1
MAPQICARLPKEADIAPKPTTVPTMNGDATSASAGDTDDCARATARIVGKKSELARNDGCGCGLASLLLEISEGSKTEHAE